METTTLHLHTAFTVDTVDPRIFGGFLEHLGRAVYDGVYNPESVHADDMGCRKDVLAALRRLNFTAMRYPGGNFVSGYHWQDAVGPREKRPKVRDIAWQSIETNQFGPDEFLELARRMDWTPMMAVNLGTGTPEEARNWLEYCNVDGGSKWADMRRENGYEEPHNVKLWCLGNEMDGPWQIGHIPAENYAILAQQTARMMKMTDPDIELVVCGSCAPDLPTYLEWDRKVLEHVRDEVEYLSLHRYVGNEFDDTEEYLAVTNSIDRQIEATDAVCLSAYHTRKTKRRVHLSCDEWNIWYRARHGEHLDGKGKYAPHLLEEQYNMEDVLVAAGFLNSFIRHADSVKIANLAQIVNVIAPIFTRGDEMFLQTIFYPIEMYSRRRTGTSLQVQVQGPGYTSKRYGKVNYLDSSAILNGDELSVFLVNRNLNEPMEVEVRLADAPIESLLNADFVAGTDPKATNTFEHPHRVQSCTHDDIAIKNGVATISLPPLSVYAGTLKIGR
ncbi:alpha-N-arabinofuranosidase [Fimbriimonas ginsengisoli]|uniref:non-reducing end alpha-L-arabinofuranosidase n=1 Tax=Fimbriimonas ginsengisoli Gsoil 348 TaxID=661478 RepID=A0A068NUM1_FIMGI|nr:alpha-L-arabinofuranosidase C-terminal domain-containing protein [Fimbriimonas ginsengisoli]AIE87126.1 alpha-L-arabinofuranosidase domain-containing protein [Fimbriimonas ginsengisoli Gsoil 348]